MRQISNAGAFMAGAASNGAHAANALAALFIATGQDAANVAESHAGVTYVDLLANGDYYWSVTLRRSSWPPTAAAPAWRPSASASRCSAATASGKVDKLAEICAGVVLAGEISLSSAVVHGDWVASHDRLGRNRP